MTVLAECTFPEFDGAQKAIERLKAIGVLSDAIDVTASPSGILVCVRARDDRLAQVQQALHAAAPADGEVELEEGRDPHIGEGR